MSTAFEQATFLWNALIRDNLRPSGPFWTAEDYPDLSGQTWVVTGATAGIGRELAKILVKQNAFVWVVGRSEAKLDAVLAELRDLKPLAKADYALVDYNDLTSVKPGIEKILKNTSKLDGIIHNAGIMHTTPAKTKQGYEQHLGVNVIAVQLVQDLLDPLIANTPHGRIVWLSSLAHGLAPVGGFDLENTDSYSANAKYGQSKALNYIQSVQWTRKHPQSTVKAVSVHPGVIKTDIGQNNGVVQKFAAWLTQYPVEYGTYAPIHAALSPDVANNEYVIPWGRPGTVRPDIYRAARNELGVKVDHWLEEQVAPCK